MLHERLVRSLSGFKCPLGFLSILFTSLLSYFYLFYSICYHCFFEKHRLEQQQHYTGVRMRATTNLFSRACCLCHMGAPDSLSRGFYCHYQIDFTLSDTGIEFTRVNKVDLHTLEG